MANLFKQTLELDNVRQEKDIFYSNIEEFSTIQITIT